MLALIEIGAWVRVADPLLVPQPTLAPADLALLLVLPPATGLVAMATAWRTVMHWLRRLA